MTRVDGNSGGEPKARTLPFRHVLVAFLAAHASIGCSPRGRTLTAIFQSEPPDAMLFAGDAFLGHMPVTIYFQVPGRREQAISLGPFDVRWEDDSIVKGRFTAHLPPWRGHFETSEFLIQRPTAPDRQMQ